MLVRTIFGPNKEGIEPGLTGLHSGPANGVGKKGTPGLTQGFQIRKFESIWEKNMKRTQGDFWKHAYKHLQK